MSNLAVVNNGSSLAPVQPSGSLSIQTVDDLGRIAKMMSASGFFADCKDAAQAGVKIMAGLELGFPAFASLVGIQIIKGKPVMGANLQAAAIKRSGKYNYRVKVHSAEICAIEFLERFDGKWESCGLSEFSLDDAKSAGLNSNDLRGDNWRKYPKNMLFARAVSNGVRWYCPDLFLGAPVYTPDEMGLRVADDGDSVSAIAVESTAVSQVETASTENFDRIAAMLKLLGTPVAQAKIIRQGLLGNKHPKDYKQDEMSQLQDALLIDWASQFPCWEHDNHRVNAYHKFVESFDGVPTDEELFALWKEECEIRVDGMISDALDAKESELPEGSESESNPF